MLDAQSVDSIDLLIDCACALQSCCCFRYCSGRKRLRAEPPPSFVVSDQGPGIADVPTVMRDGYSSGAGLGIGLPGARRLVDDFDINSELGKGTVVTMKKWVA